MHNNHKKAAGVFCVFTKKIAAVKCALSNITKQRLKNRIKRCAKPTKPPVCEGQKSLKISLFMQCY